MDALRDIRTSALDESKEPVERFGGVTAVVDAAGQTAFLSQCLKCLAQSSLVERVIVVSDEILQLPTGVHNVLLTGAKSAILNEAAKWSSSDFLLFLSSAAIPCVEAIAYLHEDLVRDLSIGAVGPRLVSQDGSPIPSEFIFIEDHCRRRPLDTRLSVTQTRQSPGWRVPPGDVIALQSWALMVRQTAFWGVGGFGDTGLAQDMSFGLALKEQNWRVCFDGDAVLTCMQVTPCPSMTIEEQRRFSQRWYSKVTPHAYRSADGVTRQHPWWNAAALSGQAAENPFEPVLAPALHKAGTIPGERCSVVVVTYNSNDSIQACVESVVQHLGIFDELIVVDNASRDQTPGYLDSLRGVDPRVQVILNSENIGFSEGCNVGIRAAAGDYIVLLNPDTQVADGWLARLRDHFRHADVGAVGPISNYVTGLQGYRLHFPASIGADVSPAKAQEIAAGANARRSIETKLLIGFCMMISRSALDNIGLLDAELFLGCDDLDLSWRLRLAGYRLLVASDVFVLHEGQVSFRTELPEVLKHRMQASTDTLARKLAKHYGAANVPSPAELWGIDWFRPSGAAMQRAA